MQVDIKKLEVLLVDGNLAFLCSAAKHMEREGIHCSIAALSRDAETIFATEKIDMVVANQILPDNQGNTLLYLLNQRKSFTYKTLMVSPELVETYSKRFPEYFVTFKPKVKQMTSLVRHVLYERIWTPPELQEKNGSQPATAKDIEN